MKKIVKAVISVVFSCVFLLAGSACRLLSLFGVDGLVFSLTEDGKSYEVTGLFVSDANIVIPETHKGLPVTGIIDFVVSASIGDEKKYITLPDTITYVAYGAFEDGIDHVQYNEYGGALYLGNEHNPYVALIYVRSNATELSVHKDAKAIALGAFEGVTALESIAVEDGNTHFSGEGNAIVRTSDRALVGVCKNSDIPETVTAIEGHLFAGRTDLTELALPDAVTRVGKYAFSDCKALSEISLSEGLVTIDAYAFRGCAGLAEVVLPSGVITVGEGAFADCVGLTEMVFPDGVKTIGGGAFGGCTRLEEVRLGSGLTGLGDHAFKGCSALTEIMLPKSLTELEYNAFSNCESLKRIAVEEGNSKYRSVNNCIVDIERKALVVGLSTSVIPTDGSVKEIDGYAFSGCEGLTEITVPDGVTQIGRYAFYNCRELKNVVLPTELLGREHAVGSSAFANCSLENIYFRGTEEQWKELLYANASVDLRAERVYYYSETEPLKLGNYWRYVDGTLVVWG